MEVVGLCASIITILEVSAGGIKVAQTFKGAREDLQALETEIENIQNLVKYVQDLPLKVVSHKAIVPALEQCKKAGEATRYLKEYELTTPDANLRRFAWVRKQPQVQRVRNQMKEARDNLTAAISIAISSSTSQIEAEILFLRQDVTLLHGNHSSLSSNVAQLSLDLKDNGSQLIAGTQAAETRWKRLESQAQRNERMFSAALDWLSQLPLLLISGPNDTGPRKLIMNPSQDTAQSSDWQTMLMDYSNKEDGDDDDEFFDCVSVMSAVEKALTPTASGLESSSRFYPEQYTINTATLQRIHVIAMVPQRETALGRIDSFYFWYNEGPRTWRRIIANVHVSRDSRHFAATVVASPDDFFKNLDLLPAPLQFAFTKLLDNITLKHAVTRLDLSLEDRPSEQNMWDIRPQGGEVQPLEPEATKYLDMCSDIGTPIYTEDDVVTYSSATSTLYVVSLGTKLCIERRLPFDSNAMAIFWQNLKLLHCMAGSTAVISLVGVVVYENRSQPRGFLYEYLRYQSIGSYLEDADLDGETIPWTRREKWARQIVQSIADCHARGFTIGDTGCLRVFGLDPYDDAKLVRIFGLTPSQHTCDSIPPELRSNSQSEVPYKTAEWTTRCDLFRLGQCLWMLAQRKVKVCSQFCPSLTCSCDSCCTLPSDNSDATMGQSLQDAPSYYKHLIRVCLSSNPNERLPASTLLSLFPPVHSPFGAMTKQSTPAPAKVWPAFSNPSFWCDICDMKVSGDLYHCGICNDGNYDICAPCINDGLHCKDTEHPLVRRAVSNGVLVSLSDYELQVQDKGSNAIVEPVLMQMK